MRNDPVPLPLHRGARLDEEDVGHLRPVRSAGMTMSITIIRKRARSRPASADRAPHRLTVNGDLRRQHWACEPTAPVPGQSARQPSS